MEMEGDGDGNRDGCVWRQQWWVLGQKKKKKCILVLFGLFYFVPTLLVEPLVQVSYVLFHFNPHQTQDTNPCSCLFYPVSPTKCILIKLKLEVSGKYGASTVRCGGSSRCRSIIFSHQHPGGMKAGRLRCQVDRIKIVGFRVLFVCFLNYHITLALM